MCAFKLTESLWHCVAGYPREVKPTSILVGEKAGAMEFFARVAYWPVYLSALRKSSHWCFILPKNVR